MVDLSFVRLQTAIFLTALDLTRKLDLAVAVRKASDSLFDADPLIVPIPADAPPEIPRLQVRSRDGRWTCLVAGSRMDIVFELPPDRHGTTGFDQAVADQAVVCKSTWSALQSEYAAVGNRIGIVSLFLGTADNAIQLVRTRFLLPSDAPEPHELQLHALHRMTLGPDGINRWTRCVASASEGLIQLEVDINTLPEQRFNVTPANIQHFSEKVRSLVTDTKASLFQGDSPTAGVF